MTSEHHDPGNLTRFNTMLSQFGEPLTDEAHPNAAAMYRESLAATTAVVLPTSAVLGRYVTLSYLWGNKLKIHADVSMIGEMAIGMPAREGLGRQVGYIDADLESAEPGDSSRASVMMSIHETGGLYLIKGEAELDRKLPLYAARMHPLGSKLMMFGCSALWSQMKHGRQADLLEEPLSPLMSNAAAITITANIAAVLGNVSPTE